MDGRTDSTHERKTSEANFHFYYKKKRKRCETVGDLEFYIPFCVLELFWRLLPTQTLYIYKQIAGSWLAIRSLIWGCSHGQTNGYFHQIYILTNSNPYWPKLIGFNIFCFHHWLGKIKILKKKKSVPKKIKNFEDIKAICFSLHWTQTQ